MTALRPHYAQVLRPPAYHGLLVPLGKPSWQPEWRCECTPEHASMAEAYECAEAEMARRAAQPVGDGAP